MSTYRSAGLPVADERRPATSSPISGHGFGKQLTNNHIGFVTNGYSNSVVGVALVSTTNDASRSSSDSNSSGGSSGFSSATSAGSGAGRKSSGDSSRTSLKLSGLASFAPPTSNSSHNGHSRNHRQIYDAYYGGQRNQRHVEQQSKVYQQQQQQPYQGQQSMSLPLAWPAREQVVTIDGEAATARCRAGLRAFLHAKKDKYFCAMCHQGFASEMDEIAHRKSSAHNLQFMKVNYAKHRTHLQKNKMLVTVTAQPETIRSNGRDTAVGKLLVALDSSAGYNVLINSCDAFIKPEGVQFRHPALDLQHAISVSAGQTITIEIHFTTYIPVEVRVPIGLRMSIEGKQVPFHIIREVCFICCSEDLTPEATMGDDVPDMKYHHDEFPDPQEVIACEKVRTNNDPALSLPSLPTYEVPEKLKGIHRFIASLRDKDTSQMDHFTIECFEEIKKLLQAPVCKKIYVMKFTLMLYLEELAKRSQLMSQNLAAISLEQRDDCSFQVHLPGLPERRPAINVGNKVLVRETVESLRAYQGEFTSIDDCFATFKVASSFCNIFRHDDEYSLQFEFNRRVFRIMHQALNGVEPKVMAEGYSCLFPQAKLLKRSPCVPLMSAKEVERIKFFDKNVKDNPEQHRAVQSILQGSHRPAPFILFGPPGTGKTSTIAEAVKQIVTLQKSARILVCASSNSACDVLCEKLLGDVSSKLIFRMYSASMDVLKMSSVIQEKGCHNYRNGAVEFPVECELSQYRVIICTLVTSWRFGAIKKPFFSHVFIDECGFAQEPEALIPVHACLEDWKSELELKPSGHLIVAGDIKQLGPVLASSMVAPYLSVSFMERLMSDTDGPYRKPYDATYIVKLLRNYRSHENILEVPNRLFYDDELKVYADQRLTRKFINWQHLINKDVPLIFHNCVSEERRDQHSTSFFNLAEAETVLHYVTAILQDPNVRPNDIGVITPYAAQARRIRSLFLRKCLSDVKVGSVEEFQGQERLVIIISSVRNSKDLLQRDLLQKLGFLKNPKRFNVAITRAKALLICIGNASILKRDVCWAAFIQYVEEHNAWAGVPQENILLSNQLTEVARLTSRR